MSEQKMTKVEFNDGVETFLAILKAQPGMIHPQHVSVSGGEGLAEMAAAFSTRLHALKNKSYERSER